MSVCASGWVSVAASGVVVGGNGSALVCQQCSQLYAGCALCNNATCTSCSSPLLMSNRSCVTACAQGYLNVSNNCVICQSPCSTCISFVSNCSSCIATYYLYFNITLNSTQCVKTCPERTYTGSVQCLACNSPCMTCANSSTSCIVCLSTFNTLVINNTLSCVTACPTNSYTYQSICKMCPSSCSLCDPIGCTACDTQYYSDSGQIIGNITYYECYLTCPSNLPYLINSTCSACAANCTQCDSTRCLQCKANLSAYGEYCLSQCPPTYVSQAGVCIIPP